MNIIKRDGSLEEYSGFKLLETLLKLSKDLDIDENILYSYVSSLSIPNIIKIEELLSYISHDLHEKILSNYNFTILAGRVYMLNIKSKAHKSFKDYIEHFKELFNTSFLTKYYQDNDIIDKYINYELNKSFGYLSIIVLRSYLLEYNHKIEDPQYLFMRIAITVSDNNIFSITKTYDFLSKGLYIHGSPTLFNAGLTKQQMSSCYLLQSSDSIDGIFTTIKDIALISKGAGGIGISLTNIRNEDSVVAKVNKSNGIVPLLKVLSSVTNYVNQSGKRPGSAAAYLEPWHPDIVLFIKAKKFIQNEEFSAKDLFYGLWIPDIFMRRLKTNQPWSLFDPSVCYKLNDTYGEEFDKLYEEYEKQKLYVKQIDIRELWNLIINTQIETGGPYILYKDTCNKLSNQNNLGTIKSSNLCAEIIQYSSENRISVCNLCSINLSKMIKNKKFDFDRLYETTDLVTKNLNNIIDINTYPCEKARLSNLENRPIGIGVQGLADLFQELGLAFEDEEAKELNKRIFETIYHSALNTSIYLAKLYGPYKNFKGSLLSKGILSFDFHDMRDYKFMHNFEDLRNQIKQYGIYNSLLIAVMPTATTSQILSNNDCVEPWISNIYYKKILNGNFKMVNKRMVDELQKLGLWNNDVKEKIIKNNGSILNNLNIPYKVRKIYKTAYELDPNLLLDYYISRSKFVDQSQSMNIYISNDNPNKYNTIHRLLFKGWSNLLKTGSYYIRIEEKPSQAECESCAS